MKKTVKNNINANTYFTKNMLVKALCSTFPQHKDKKILFNMGELVPFHIQEVLPSDTFSISVATVTKLLSPQIKPVLDNLKQTIWAFYVPTRLVQKNWKELIAGHSPNPDWSKDVELTMDLIKIPKTGFAKFSLASYIGGINITNPKSEITSNNQFCDETIIAAPFRAYCMIWNYFFKDEAINNDIDVINDLEVPLKNGAANIYYNETIDGQTVIKQDIYKSETSPLAGGCLLPLAKVHDYFTSALPAPQKGAPVTLPLGDTADVINDTDLTKIDATKQDKIVQLFAFNGFNNSNQINFQTYEENIGTSTGLYTNNNASPSLSHSWQESSHPANHLEWGNNSVDGIGKNGESLYGIAPFGSNWQNISGSNEDGWTQEHLKTRATQLFHNLKADLSTATAVSINDLRYAFQLQLIKECDARYGTRYGEYLYGHFGVVIGDARIQQPEFLGMKSFKISSFQIAQTSATEAGNTPQGNLSAYAESATIGHLFTKSFVEHGYVILLTGIRQQYHIYSQGLDKMWTRKTRFDYYLPELKHIGEQPIKNKEIFFNKNDESENNETFGFQEAWAEYRYLQNEVGSGIKPNDNNNLSLYTYADNFTKLPTLSPDFIKSNDTALKNTLAIQPTIDLKEFISDIYIVNKATRPLPTHSIPGLMDHHGKLII